MFRAIIIGNLGADARVENNNGRPFVSFNVGHNDRYTDANGVEHNSTQWISCALNGDGGRLLPYLKKGRAVYVEGRCSTRVFSSEKLRRMVAGVNVSVDHLELLGGNSDDVPRSLVDSDGTVYPVSKAFYIEPSVAATLVGSGASAVLSAADGRQFAVVADGWVNLITGSNDNEVQ